MTKALLLALIALLVTACKKEQNTNPPQEQKTRVLSAIYINNIINERFFYGADKKIIKTESYNPDGSLYKTDHYGYDAAAVLSSVTGLLPDGSLKTKMTFSKNAAGQIVSGDFINVGITSYTTKYEYAAGSDQVVKTTNLDAGGNGQNFAEHDYNNSVLKEQRYYDFSPAGVAMLNVKNKYVITANENRINRYKSLVAPFTDPQPDNWIMYQLLDSAKSFNYNGMIVTSEKSYVISEKQYDAQEYLLSMTITIKNIIPVLADIVIKVRYEYTEL